MRRIARGEAAPPELRRTWNAKASRSGHKAGSALTCHRRNGNMIKAIIGAAVILVIATSAASAQHRAGDAALGAVSGAVVLGPVGAVAGAFIGYSAGPSIARSWGIDRSRAARQRRQASRESVRRARAEVVSPGGEAN